MFKSNNVVAAKDLDNLSAKVYPKVYPKNEKTLQVFDTEGFCSIVAVRTEPEPNRHNEASWGFFMLQPLVESIVLYWAIQPCREQ